MSSTTNKKSTRDMYRTPTPFPASREDADTEHAKSPEIDEMPSVVKVRSNYRSNRASKPASNTVNLYSSDDEVEFVETVKSTTSNTLKSNAKNQDVKPNISNVNVKSYKVRLDLDSDSENRLEPSPVIVNKPRAAKDRPKPIPIFKKNKVQPPAEAADDSIPVDNHVASDAEDSTNERTPKPSRVMFVDNDTTPVARISPPHLEADIDVTPKAERINNIVSSEVTTSDAVQGRQTRSSNGISKKRVLQDAAILSSDDDLPSHIIPKKFKSSIFECPVDSDEEEPAATSNIEPIKLGFRKSVSSVSKGKKKAATEIADKDDESRKRRYDPPSNEDDVFAAELSLATHLSTIEARTHRAVSAYNQESASTSRRDDTESSGRLHPDEIAAIDAAMRKTRDDAIRAAVSAKAADAAKAAEVTKALEAARASRVPDNNTAPARADSTRSDSTFRALDATGHSPSTTESSNAGMIHQPTASSDAIDIKQHKFKGRRTFADMVKTPGKTPMMNSGPVLLDDTMKFRVPSLPVKCDVTRAHLQDSLLASEYANLPNLRLGALRPWNAAPGSGSTMISVWFSGWADQCPNLDFDTACSIIRMQKYKNFINPSRASPLDVNILYTSHDNKRSILQSSFKTAVCLSPILTRDSYLLEPTTTGLRNKYLSGHFHHQEWERLEAFACMVFDKKVMTAQIRDGALSFTTMGNARGDRDMSSPNRPPRNPSMLSAASSRGQSTKARSTKPDANVRSVLDVSDDIPVYDARGVSFNFASDLESMEDMLPKWIDEIPSHSFAVVGFTMGHYEKDNRANLTTNILFVILLATEGSDE